MRATEKKEFLYIGITLLLLLILALCVNLAPLSKFKSGNKLQFLGLMSTLNILFWVSYKASDHIFKDHGSGHNGWKRSFAFIENNSLLLLCIFIALSISWLGFAIFRNPYLYTYNHGDGAGFTQMLHNICKGVGPEISTYSTLEACPASTPYFYISIFISGICLLPLLILAPLYWLHPYPPMHVFAVVIAVVSFGSLGIYLAIRAMGGSKTLSLLGAIGYCIMPLVEHPILYKGYCSNLGFAVYPYIFAFLFSRKWNLFYISSFLLSSISLAYVYSVIALGVIAAIFFKARKQAVVVFLIAILMMVWGKAVFEQSIRGIWASGMLPPDFFTKNTLTWGVKALLKPLVFNAFYIVILLMSVSFLPLFGIRTRKAWNWPVIGMLSLALIGAVMGIRGQGWSSQRNNNMVVPIYLAAFMTYLNIRKEEQYSKSGPGPGMRKSAFFGFLLLSSIISMSLWFTLYYPWRIELKRPVTAGTYSLSTNHGSVSVLNVSPNKTKLEGLLHKINEFVPADASIAYRIDDGLEAFLVNRQKVWRIGTQPEGVEYYIVQIKAIDEISDNYSSWQEWLKKIEHDDKLKLLYKNEFVSIYKNARPVEIPRREGVLGWNVLFKALLHGK